MADVRIEQIAKEITIAIISRFDLGGAVEKRAGDLGKAAGQIYAEVIKAVVEANK